MQINALTAATEATCLVLSVDETVTNPKVREGVGRWMGGWVLMVDGLGTGLQSEAAQGEAAAQGMGRGRGGGGMRGRGMRRR